MFLNHQLIHVPLYHARLCLSLSTPAFESVKVGGYLDMILCTITQNTKKTQNCILGVFIGSNV